MGVAKAILIGGIGFGLAAWFFHSHDASAASGGANTMPPGWQPPANAVRASLPSSIVGMPLNLASWPADPGQPPGTFLLYWSTTDPKTFLALFWATGQPSPAVMAVGSTPQSITLQQAIPQLVQSAHSQGFGG